MSSTEMSTQFTNALENQRRQVEGLAQTLAEQATDQWRKAIEGMVALPAAVAVGTAATALYAVSFVARGFEVFQRREIQTGRDGVEARGREREGREREGREREGREREGREPGMRPEGMPSA